MTDYEGLYNAAMETLKVKEAEVRKLEDDLAEKEKAITANRIKHEQDFGSLKTAHDLLKTRHELMGANMKVMQTRLDKMSVEQAQRASEFNNLQTANTLSKQQNDLLSTDIKTLRTNLDRANADLVTERSRRIQPELKKNRDDLVISDSSKVLAGLRREVSTLQSQLDEQRKAIKRSNLFTQTLQAKLNESGEALQNMVNEKYPDQLRDKDATIKELRDRVGMLEVEAKKDGIEIAKLRQKTKGA